jgi:succinoglycan biosynthesis transport protein ExoP
MYDKEYDRVSDDETVSSFQFLSVLFKRKGIILTFFFTVVITVTVGSFLMPPVYEANSKVLLEREMDSEKSVLFRMNLSQGYQNEEWLNSEIEIMKSYPVAVTVVEGLSLHLEKDDTRPYSEAEEKQKLEEGVKTFLKKLNVENIKNSNVVSVSYQAKDPELAALVVNDVVENYTLHRSEISDESDIYNFFKDQMQIVDDKLREVEQRQADYKMSEEVISPEVQRQILMTRLADYEKSLTEARTRRIGKESKLSVIREQISNGKEISIPAIETSDSPSREKYIAKLKGELLDLEIQRERLLQKFTPKYEEVINLDRQIEATRGKIVSEIQQIVEMEEASIRALKAEERVLQNTIRRLKNEIRDLAQKEYEYAQISRGLDDNREVYSMLLKQREETRISLAKLEKGIKIKVISQAVAPAKPVSPRKMLNVILAVFLGLFGGLGLAFMREYFDHSLSTPSELEKYTGLNVLGSVRKTPYLQEDGHMHVDLKGRERV